MEQITDFGSANASSSYVMGLNLNLASFGTVAGMGAIPGHGKGFGLD